MDPLSGMAGDLGMNDGYLTERLALDRYEETHKAWQTIIADGARIAREYRAAEAELKRVLRFGHPLLHNGICYYLDGYDQIQRVLGVVDITEERG